MRSILAESTSPTGRALEPVAKAASSSPRGIVGPGERRRFCPKPPSQPLLTLAVRKADTGHFSIRSRVLKDFPFSIPFPGCAPSEMSKAAQKQAGMALVGTLGAGFFCFSLEEFSPIRVASIQ